MRELILEFFAIVWTVECLANGDIAAGSSDGLIRVFTRKEERVADLETLTVSWLSLLRLESMSDIDLLSIELRQASFKQFSQFVRSGLFITISSRSPDNIGRTQVGDVKKNDLPGLEALQNDGKKEGQVVMVKTASGSVEAHQVRTSSPSSHQRTID